MHDGQTDVFATGVYLDTLRAQGNQLKFASQAGGVRFLAHRHADGDPACKSDGVHGFRPRQGHQVSLRAERDGARRGAARRLRAALLLPQGRLRHLQGPDRVRRGARLCRRRAERSRSRPSGRCSTARPGRAPISRSRRSSIEKADPFARKTLNARVFRIDAVADDVMLVHLRYPAGERVRFKAGQYVSILMDERRAPRLLDGQSAARERRRSASRPPCPGRRVHHLRVRTSSSAATCCASRRRSAVSRCARATSRSCSSPARPASRRSSR